VYVAPPHGSLAKLTTTVMTPKQSLHSFAFPSNPSGQSDVLVVGKDGSLSIGPMSDSPAVSFLAHIFADISSHLHRAEIW
jgi:hypothetical protein